MILFRVTNSARKRRGLSARPPRIIISRVTNERGLAIGPHPSVILPGGLAGSGRSVAFRGIRRRTAARAPQ